MRNLAYDIAIAPSRKAAKYKNISLSWPGFVECFLNHQRRTEESYESFMSKDKESQTNIKDIGGFVGGYLNNGSRKEVRNRGILCLDIDYAPSVEAVKDAFFPGTAGILHSTHKHCPQNPRLRLIVPLNRLVTPAEYEALARMVASKIGIEMFDQTTYQPGRMMFWQSTSKDGEQVYEEFKGEPLDVDKVLSKYKDTIDIREWPLGERENKELREKSKKMGNPLEKPGIIGEFCRAYPDIRDAIAKYVPEYKPTDDHNRYTYTGGTTCGGVLIFDNGLFSYSYHDHDPCSRREVNAFDLVRIHRFGHLDKNSKANKPTNLPSFKAMIGLVENDERCKEGRKKKTIERFKIQGKSDDYINAIQQLKEELESRLKSGKKGDIIQDLVELVYINHPDLGKDLFAYDEFLDAIVFTRTPNWKRSDTLTNMLTDGDTKRIKYIFGQFGLVKCSETIDTVISKWAGENAFHPVRKYLEGLKWDGKPRVATLLTDFFGGDDNEYNRVLSTLFLKAGVMRIFRPGCKFDHVLVLAGPQGCGKSTMAQRLGKQWFTDSIQDFKDKDAREGLLGNWIIEIAEMRAVFYSDSAAAKQFISTTNDKFRLCYGRRSSTHKRQCIFIATTNNTQIFSDLTGNRRYLIFEIAREAKPKYDFYTELTDEYVDQVWAEAYQMVQAEDFNSCLDIPKNILEMANNIQNSFMQSDPIKDTIEQYLDLDLPFGFDDFNIENRRTQIQRLLANDDPEITHKKRQRVCVKEIWIEALNHYDCRDLDNKMSRQITRILDTIPGWQRIKTSKCKWGIARCGPYGRQKCYERIPSCKKHYYEELANEY